MKLSFRPIRSIVAIIVGVLIIVPALGQETDSAPEMDIQLDVRIPTRHGFTLSANVFKPLAPGRFPVLMAVSPYDKDHKFPYNGIFGTGQILVSENAPFEMPDPEYWVHHGYVVIAVDTVGGGKSGGDVDILSDYEAQAYYDAIEWAGTRDWSNGNVGLNGVSYMAMSQWPVAALNPPHLKAIMPVEGLTDLYRDLVFNGGIPETGFIEFWPKLRIIANKNPAAEVRTDLATEYKQHPLFDDFWAAYIPDLESISVPAYVTASWSDHGLHSRGTLIGFEQLGSQDKWLEIHGRKKWEYYYGRDFLERQRRFFDYYLKGTENDMQDVPRVRYELRNGFYDGDIRYAADWPLPEADYRPFYLHSDHSLRAEPQDMSAKLSYQSDDGSQLLLTHTFAEDTEITGPMKLKLWVATGAGDDMDLFVGLSKLDRRGNEVFFSGFDEIEHGHVATGWLRVSQRELDAEKSKPYRPILKHQRSLKLKPGEIVEVDVEILPASTLFKKDESLALRLQGSDLPGAGEFARGNPVNVGRHSVHLGGRYPSHLLLPIIESEDSASR